MQRVLTLLYHRVIHLKQDKNLLAVTPDNFYKQMLYLKKNYPIVRLEEDWDKLSGNSVCITFDDGYMDNFTNALPILQELHIPATIFVSTGTVNTEEEFWWDELERLLLDRERKYKKTFALEDDLFSCQWPTETYGEREELYDTLHWLMYDKISVRKRNEWIEQLREWSGAGQIGREKNYAMQTAKADMNHPLLTLGAHTVNHPSLGGLPEEEQYDEISRSKKDLESWTGRKTETFSYPFGTEHDFNQTTIDICRRENIRKAVVNIPGIWNSQCNPYLIPRNIIRNWNIEEYKKRIDSFWDSCKTL